jgi:glycosidase
MKWNKVQLMIYGQNLVNLNAKFNTDYIKVSKIHTVENQKYAFIDVEIGQQLTAGDYTLTISRGNERVEISFSILERVISEDRHQGFSAEDVIYLITPDRFVNGDTSNDIVDGMLDTLDRTDKLRRHGGDIQGIIDKLDYLKDLGITAIWVNPLLENDMKMSYHGYAATDLYRIDPRFGSNELYIKLVREAHKKGLKIIMDHVSNHVGINHPWIEDLPATDWLNASIEDHRQNRHYKEVLLDIHADHFFLENLRKGWFVPSMPDLNQANPYLAKYLIQNTLWWIEFSGIDGIREDTYPYVDETFLADWARTVLNEYPNFNIVGEIWIHDPVYLAPYQKDNYMLNECNTYLPSITDFGIFEAFGRVFNRDQSIEEIYKFLSRDFLYPDPYNLVIFLDNHDVMRAMDLVHNNPQRLKMALQILLTIRGIPQIYYGTEIGMACGSKDHALIRQDFPGGFPDDERDAFTAVDRTDMENEIFNHLYTSVF